MMRSRADHGIRNSLFAMALVCGAGLAFGSGAATAAGPDTGLVSEAQAAPVVDLHPAGAANLVQDLGKQTAQAMASKAAEKPAKRREMLRRLVREGFDLELTSQFVLGKHWHRASPEQRAEFTELFTEYLLNSYARHLASFRADTLRVVGSHPVGDDDILVETSVEGSDGSADPVWRVRSVEGQYKIIDVTVDGVSLALTQRREFASVVNRVGLDGLLKLLREKLADQAKMPDRGTRQAAHASFLGSLLASPNARRLDLFVAGK